MSDSKASLAVKPVDKFPVFLDWRISSNSPLTLAWLGRNSWTVGRLAKNITTIVHHGVALGTWHV